LQTSGCRIYYNELLNEGTIPGLDVDVLQIWDTLPEDINGDCHVDSLDLASLLGSWGACPEPCELGEPEETCPQDLNGDCVVGPIDLAFLTYAWGQTPE